MKKNISLFKKALSRFSALLLVLTVSIMSLALTASAAKKQQFKLDSAQDIEIVLLYDGDAPTFTVKAPGKTFSKDQDYTKIEKKTGVSYLYIKDAPAGSWTIEASKDFDFNVLKWYGSVSITSFRSGTPDKDKIKFKAEIKADENAYVKWYVYATADSSITGVAQKIQLDDGSAQPGKEFTKELDIKNLPDGEWKLTLDAVAEYGDGLEADAHAEADKSFTVTGHTPQGDTSLITTNYDITQQTIYVDWSKIETYYDSMLVSVVDKDGEILVYDEIDRDTTATSFLANSDVTLRLMPIYNNVFKEVYNIKLSCSPKVKVTIDTPELTGDLMVQISYDTGDAAVPADITLNGKKSTYNLTGKGTMSLPLDQMNTNQISVTYYPSANERYTISKTVNVQSAPSSIEFFGVKDRLVTDRDTITLSGRTDPDVKLTLGEAEIKVEESGDFTAVAELEKGENVLTFNIESPMGIRTTRTITVVRTISGGTASAAMSNSEIPLWLQLVFGAAVVVLSAAGILIGIRIAKKKNLDMQGKILLVFRIFLIISFVLLIAAGAFCLYECIKVSSSISGDKLIDRLEIGDYDGLDGVLSIRDTWLSRMITLFIMAGICAVVFVITIFIGKWLKKRIKKPKKPKPPKKPREPKAPKPAPQQLMAQQPVQQPVSLEKAPQDTQQAQGEQSIQYPQYPQYTQGEQSIQYPQYPQYTQGEQSVQYPQYTQNGQPAQYPQYTQNGQPVQYPQYTQNGQPVQYPQYTQNGQPVQYPQYTQNGQPVQYPQYTQNGQPVQYPQYPQNGQQNGQ